MDQLIPLNLLSFGEQGRVAWVDGPTNHVHHLAEMGIRPGTHIEIVRAGSPCIARINGRDYGFRLREDITVLVAIENQELPESSPTVSKPR